MRRALAIVCSLWLAGPAFAQTPGAGVPGVPVSGPATPTGPLPFTPATIVNPMDPAYGAKCDGATDDSAALQAAINAAQATGTITGSGAGVVVLPGGKKCYTASLNITRPIVIASSGHQAATLRLNTGSPTPLLTVKMAYDTSNYYNLGYGPATLTLDNVRLQGSGENNLPGAHLLDLENASVNPIYTKVLLKFVLANYAPGDAIHAGTSWSGFVEAHDFDAWSNAGSALSCDHDYDFKFFGGAWGENGTGATLNSCGWVDFFATNIFSSVGYNVYDTSTGAGAGAYIAFHSSELDRSTLGAIFADNGGGDTLLLDGVSMPLSGHLSPGTASDITISPNVSANRIIAVNMTFNDVYPNGGNTAQYNVQTTTGLTAAAVNVAGSGYTGASGTMTWSGGGCSVNPVLNVTTSVGTIASVSSVAAAGICNTTPSAAATTWTPGGGLTGGSGASFTPTTKSTNVAAMAVYINDNFLAGSLISSSAIVGSPIFLAGPTGASQALTPGQVSLYSNAASGAQLYGYGTNWDAVIGNRNRAFVLGVKPNSTDLSGVGSLTGITAFGVGGTAPTANTGTCTASSLSASKTAGSFTAPACAGGTIILSGLPTQSHGYACDAWDQTTPADTLKQTANSATSVTFTGTTAAGDVVVWKCLGF